jgi:hypothetical protein
MKIRIALLAALCSCFFISSVPLFAQTTTPPGPAPVNGRAPWQHMTEELIFSADLSNNQAADHTSVTINASWGHYATDKTEIGAIISVLRGPVNGYAGGPWTEFNFPSMRYGNLAIGGDAQFTTGDLLNAAQIQAATRFLYKLYVGKSSAVRAEIYRTQAIAQSGPDTGQPLNALGFRIGISLGIPNGTQVQ